jgi:uncharacterized RDD family membrane protein YckC
VFSIYCSKCGKELIEGSNFCQSCGAAVNFKINSEISLIERFGKDQNLQEHWIKRVIAFIIDSIIVSIGTAILLILVLFPIFIANPTSFFNIISFPFQMGILSLLYFVIAENSYGTTIGKQFLGLQVVAKKDQRINLEKAFIRNISKIHVLLLLLDIFLGILTSTDLLQKYSDRIAQTKVVYTNN